MICPECNHDNPKGNSSCDRCHARLHRAKLRIALGERHQTRLLFPRNYTIGRGIENDIVIADTSVSRNHATLEYRDGVFIINDHDSKNGSLLNNIHFKSEELHDRDCIQLGHVVIHFFEERDRPQMPDPFVGTVELVQKEFFNLTQKLQSNLSTDYLLQTMLSLALSLVHADKALLFRLDIEGQLTFLLGKDKRRTGISANDLSNAEWQLITRAVEVQQTQLQRETAHHATGDNAGEQTSWRRMAVPLITDKIGPHEQPENQTPTVLGVCYFSKEGKGKPISESKQALLNTLMAQAAFAIENEMLYDEALEKRKIRDELTRARDIQQRLLPTTHHQAADVDLVSFNQPCEAISGDYFDFISITKRTVAIAIGDICGHGIPAALLSSTVQAAIRSQLEYTASPDKIIRNLNRLLIQSTAESIFLTLFFGVLDLKSGEFSYINAGHPPPIFISKNLQITELSATMPALGILESEFDQVRTAKFQPGDILLMYTDGFIESQNKQKQIYSRKRFLQLIHRLFLNEKTRTTDLDGVVDNIRKDVLAFMEGAKQTDDLTLVAVRRR